MNNQQQQPTNPTRSQVESLFTDLEFWGITLGELTEMEPVRNWHEWAIEQAAIEAAKQPMDWKTWTQTLIPDSVAA
jgi:hypothetical protein